MEQFIGDRKVMVLVDLSEKTPAGNKMIEVSFVDGTKEVMPEMRFNLIVTNILSDASQVQNKINSGVGAHLFGVLHEFGILMGEGEEVLNSASTFINSGYEKARDIKWGCALRLLPLNVINKVLIDHNAEQNNNGTGTAGSGSDKTN